ncbi:hypothetical protein ACFY2W_30895 [Streptomyces sp. NPDC001262]|uniref:hypothetical protein n=1 Tax=Streptomyces sp. NPDC001262 TaxID=3364552 RepID=UPI0036A75D10
MNRSLRPEDARSAFADAMRAAMEQAAATGARKPTLARIAKATEIKGRQRISASSISAWRKGDRVPGSRAALRSFLAALEESASLPQGLFDRDHWDKLYDRACEAPPLYEDSPGIETLRVREAQPLELGVHRARTTSDGNAVPFYIPRDVDAAVRSALSRGAAEGTVVVLVGDSTAGKTRCAYEAMSEVLPEHLLVAPLHLADIPEAISAVTHATADGERCVLWLNDMEKFLSPEGMSLRDMRSLRAARAVVVGTIRTRIRNSLPADGLGNEVLNLAEEFEINRLWSASEVDRAQCQFRRERDPRLRLALAQADDFGIAESMATGPQLWKLLNRASRVNENPRGAALVWAAIDLALAGLTGPLAAGLLNRLHEEYLPGRNKQLIGPEPLDEAYAWATEPRDGVTRLLIPDGNGLRVFDYLLDAHLRDKGASPELIRETAWEAALETADRTQRFGIAMAAYANNRADICLRSLRPLTDHNDVEALRALGVLRERHDHKEAIQWLMLAIAEGDVLSLRLMGNLHARAQDWDSANEWYRKAAKSGDEVSQAYYSEPQIAPPRPSVPAGVTPERTEPEGEKGDHEDEEEWEERGPSQRTMSVLEAAFGILADAAFDSLEEVGDERVDLSGNYTFVFSDLPVPTWGQSAEWRRRMARCFDDLADDIRADVWPQPTCTGEEMAMHLALEHASSMVSDEPEFTASLVAGIPTDPTDYDWDLCMTLFLEDTDVLFLYEPWQQGTEDPDNPFNQWLGIANLEADQWFEPFYENRARDPERGFRR